MSDLARGAGYLLQALKLLPNRRIAAFVVVPLTVNVALFSAVIWWLWTRAAQWSEALRDLLPGAVEWLSVLLLPVLMLLAAIVTAFTFTIVANFIGAPFNGALAERVMELRQRKLSAPAGRSLWAEVPIALYGELRKLAWFAMLAVPFLLLFIVPVVNAVAPFAWMAFTAWMLAAEYVDYPLGALGMGFVEQRRWLAARRPVALGFGAATLAMTMIPLVNFLAMPTAVVAATLLMLDESATEAS